MKTNDNDDLLERIFEYSKYLYEEENDRRDRLNNAVKVYLGFLTFILGVGVAKLLSLKELGLLLHTDHATLSYIGFILLGLSFALLAISFIFTILVLKMWPYERLCNPRAMLIKSIFLDKEKYLSSIITDYTVACNINFSINNKKSRLLAHALFMLVVGLIMLAISLLILKLLILSQGGAQ